MNNILILDIGNSLIKISLVNVAKEKIIKTYLFGTKRFTFWKKEIIDKLFKLKYNEVIIGSVVPSINKKIANLFPGNKKIYFIKNDDFRFLKFYKKVNIKEIGMDILSFATYLINKNNSAIGISFGTAIFSLIIKDKTIMGISIMPSIKKSFNDLKIRTELIKEINIEKIRYEFGFNTNQALESGYTHIINGFLNSILNYANDKYNINDIYITGGNYKNIDKFKFDNKFNINLKEEQIITLGYLFLYKNFLN